MKIAVCMYGIVGGTIGRFGRGEELDPALSFQNYKNLLFSGHEVDFFLHSWSVSKKDMLVELYDPIDYKFEPPQEFNHVSLSNYSLKHIETYGDLFMAYGKKEAAKVIEQQVKATHSRWLSTKRSTQLLKKHIEKSNKQYDAAYLLRYDLFFLRKQKAPTFRNNEIICCKRTKDFGEAIDDLFFCTSPFNLIKFGTLYDKITSYSVRAPFASKQHLDDIGLNIINKWEKNVDYRLIRDQLNNRMGKKAKIKSFIKNIFKKL